jgi:hypothetical protein
MDEKDSVEWLEWRVAELEKAERKRAEVAKTNWLITRFAACFAAALWFADKRDTSSVGLLLVIFIVVVETVVYLSTRHK